MANTYFYEVVPRCSFLAGQQFSGQEQDCGHGPDTVFAFGIPLEEGEDCDVRGCESKRVATRYIGNFVKTG